MFHTESLTLGLISAACIFGGVLLGLLLHGLLPDQHLHGESKDSVKLGAGMIATIVSVATLLIGANTALAELKTGLDQIWEVPSEKRQGFWYFIRTRVLSVGLILALGFLLLVGVQFFVTVRNIKPR